ncbi:MAG: YdcF family protein [Hyphomicrobiaceae bacterium]
MFYVLSKVFFFLIAPSHLCLLLLISGLVLLRRRSTERWARRLLAASATGFLVFGFSPLGSALLLPLENRFQKPVFLERGAYTGIIFLGGFEDGGVSKARNTLALVDAGERLSETIRLAHQLPTAKIIFSGGPAKLILRVEDARDSVDQYLRDVGIDGSRIVLETRSRNTWQNAVFTRKLLMPRPTDRFLLVTSAWHMPRAIGVFRKAGYHVIAYPVDYRTRGRADLWRPFSTLVNGLKRTDRALREWIGLWAYWVSGRSATLLPGPSIEDL